MTGDPVEDYAAALTGALHGPARAKARMVEEVRDGLTEAIAEHTRDGIPYHRAFDRAVRVFGAPADLIPSCQRELTISQTRHTARAIAVAAPGLAACWPAVWSAAHGPGWELPPAVQILAVNLGTLAVTAGVFSTAALALTGFLGRRLPLSDRLPIAVAWIGTVAAGAMPIATVLLTLASAPALTWPFIAFIGALTLAFHAAVAASARACRLCARLPVTEPAPLRG